MSDGRGFLPSNVAAAPRCLLSFGSLVYDRRIISLVTSDSGSLMFYDNTTLKWASQLQAGPPVCLRRGRFWDKETSQVRQTGKYLKLAKIFARCDRCVRDCWSP